MLVITNATIFDGYRLLPGRHSVTLDGNTIAAIDDPSTVTSASADTEVIDAAGMTLMPGLITSHLHADFYGDMQDPSKARLILIRGEGMDDDTGVETPAVSATLDILRTFARWG